MKRSKIAVLAALALAVAASAAQAAPTVIKVGATPVPHAAILKFVQPILKAQGIDLQIVEFTDYVQPNLALENKELDANYFQHLPYLTDFNAQHGTHIVVGVNVHFEPIGLYPGKTKSLQALKSGATIAVPNDTTNEARALLLLESAGIIKVNHAVGLKATVKDITDNPKKVKIQELEAAQVARSLPDVDLAVINGNYAIDAGLNAAKDALKAEDKDSLAAKTYANFLAVRTGDEKRPELVALEKALNSPEVKKFIQDTYKGAVLPTF
jgi:ABC-type metal ion transport system, periplasmic component/surface antigen